MPQGLGLFPHMNVAENILFADRNDTLTMADLMDGNTRQPLKPRRSNLCFIIGRRNCQRGVSESGSGEGHDSEATTGSSR